MQAHLKQITDSASLEAFVKELGWDSTDQFVAETEYDELDKLIGLWYESETAPAAEFPETTKVVELFDDEVYIIPLSDATLFLK